MGDSAKEKQCGPFESCGISGSGGFNMYGCNAPKECFKGKDGWGTSKLDDPLNGCEQKKQGDDVTCCCDKKDNCATEDLDPAFKAPVKSGGDKKTSSSPSPESLNSAAAQATLSSLLIAVVVGVASYL